MERIESYIFFIRDTISDELLRNLISTSIGFDDRNEPIVVYLNKIIPQYDEYIINMSKDYIREAYFVCDEGNAFRCVMAPKTYKDLLSLNRPDFMCDFHGIA